MRSEASLFLERIWQERVNQKVDSSLVLFDELKTRLGFPIGSSLTEAQGFGHLDPVLVSDILAMESSLARALRKSAESSRALTLVKKVSPLSSQMASFLLQFEIAIMAFSQNDWGRAIEIFQRARALARNDLERSACLMNLVLCLENLEIPFEKSIEELKPILTRIDGSLAEGIRSQLECLELREQWRLADFAFLKALENGVVPISQATYFRAYLLRIPYLSQFFPAFSTENFVKQSGHLFNKDFRLRTLSLQRRLQDASTGRIIDFIERLYLGTWGWIMEPTENRVQFLVGTFQDFPWSQIDNLNLLSVEDQSHLVLAVGWLSLFDPQLISFAQRLSSKLRFTERNQTLLAEREAQEALLSKTPCSSRLAKEIVNCIGYKKDRLESRDFADNDLILIDYSEHQVQIKGHGRFQSRAAVLALKCLKLEKVITVEKFFAAVSGGLEFDHFQHQPRVSNLIYKLNQYLGSEVRIRQKDGMISLLGSDHCISLVNFDRRHEVLAASRTWKASLRKFQILFEGKQVSKSFNLKQIFLKILAEASSFNRQDVQRIAQVSRTESHRLISQWRIRGWVRKTGFGKRTLYKVLVVTERVS